MSTKPNAERAREVRVLLTKSQKNLYFNNAWFKHSVDAVLEHLMPTILLGLEAQAREQQKSLDVAFASANALTVEETAAAIRETDWYKSRTAAAPSEQP